AAAFTIDGEKGAPVPLPAAAQAGLSYAFGVGSTLTLGGSADARITRGRTVLGLVGAELTAPQTGAALRIGWRFNDSASSLSVGAGYELRAVRLDYAFVPYDQDLGDTHRFSLSAHF